MGPQRLAINAEAECEAPEVRSTFRDLLDIPKSVGTRLGFSFILYFRSVFGHEKNHVIVHAESPMAVTKSSEFENMASKE